MGRILAIALVIYGYGDAGFDSHRPDVLDRPLHNFHRAVDTVALQVQRVLIAGENSANTVPALAKLGDKLRRVGAALAPD